MTTWISEHRRPTAVAAVAAVVVLAVVLLVARRDAGGAPAAASTASTASTAATTSSAAASATTSSTSSSTTTPAVDDPSSALAIGAPALPTDLPVDITSTPRREANGDVVVDLHLVARAGSQLYGAEARVCPRDAGVDNDADFHPTQTGRCALGPLRSGADTHVDLAASPPYQSLDLSFRTGSGTDSYSAQDGTLVTITCDACHPCDLVVKLQVPNTFGFRLIPLDLS